MVGRCGGGHLSKVQSNDPNTVTIEVVAANGQASDILEIKSHAGAVLFQVDKDGNVRVPGDVILVNGSALSAIFAPIAKGVTNGDSHIHSAGDGGQIAYGDLSGLPSLGDSAALDVGIAAGTVAAGNHGHTHLAPGSFMVYKDGSTIYVKNMATGTIEDSGTVLNTLLQPLINASTDGGGIVYIGPGEYTMDARLDLPSNWAVRGSGPATIIKGGFGLNGVETAVISAMAADPTQGGLTITVNDASGFAAGDFIKIYGTGGNCSPPGTGSSYSGNYEGSVIKSIAGNVITLENQICNVYTTAAAGAVMKMLPVENVQLADLRLEPVLSGDLIYGYWCKNIIIENIELYGNLHQGIYLATTWDSVIRACWLEYTHDAINLEICANNNTIVDCLMNGGNGNGVDIALSSQNNRIIRCTIIDCASQPAISFEYNCHRNQALDCYMRGCFMGVNIAAHGNFNVVRGCHVIDSVHNGINITGHSDNNTISDCIIEGSGEYGLFNNDSNHTQISGGIYSDNIKAPAARGIYAYRSTHLSIQGVHASGNSEHGILLSTNCSYCIIRGNIVLDNGVAGGVHTQDGIVVATNCDYNLIAENIVANSPRSEIRVHSSDCNYNTIINNLVYGTHDVAIYNAATSTVIERNSGYLTENRGRSTGTAAQQTIAHGLAAAPTQVILWNIEDAAIPYQSAAADATNIYITAASGKDYGWEARV